ncbi:hypothetical protein [Acidovorax lacteus]
MSLPPPLRPQCPPAACTCGLAALLDQGQGDLRILMLSRPEEKRLVERLERIDSLADLRHMLARMHAQLGIVVALARSPNEVRSLRGITVRVEEQPGLCRKSRQAIAAAIRRAMEQRPQIAYDWLDEGGLFAA